MTEIKSTLDIVMEKTKGLSMSEEEKKDFRRSELESKIRGLLRKYLDGIVEIERFGSEISEIGQGKEDMVREILMESCISALEPEGDNAPYLEVLRKIMGVDTGPFEKAISETSKSLEEKRKIRGQELREELGQRGISGTAVIPNVKADEGWKRVEKEVRDSFREKLRRLTEK